MKKKDIMIIVIVLVAAAVLFIATPQGRGILSRTLNNQTATPAPEATNEPTAVPTDLPTAAPAVTPSPTLKSMILEPTKAPRPTLAPAESYVRVSVGGMVYALLPLNSDTTYPIRQPDGKENVIEIGKNRVAMHSSTCDNQDCVGQGEITLENMDTRILFNMVICLPNEVSLELLTPAEAQAAYEDMTR